MVSHILTRATLMEAKFNQSVVIEFSMKLVNFWNCTKQHLSKLCVRIQKYPRTWQQISTIEYSCNIFVTQGIK